MMNDNDKYKRKYLLYKLRYLQLKSTFDQRGGELLDKFKELVKEQRKIAKAKRQERQEGKTRPNVQKSKSKEDKKEDRYRIRLGAMEKKNGIMRTLKIKGNLYVPQNISETGLQEYLNSNLSKMDVKTVKVEPNDGSNNNSVMMGILKKLAKNPGNNQVVIDEQTKKIIITPSIH